MIETLSIIIDRNPKERRKKKIDKWVSALVIILAALGTITALVSKCALVVEKKE